MNEIIDESTLKWQPWSPESEPFVSIDVDAILSLGLLEKAMKQTASVSELLNQDGPLKRMQLEECVTEWMKHLKPEFGAEVRKTKPMVDSGVLCYQLKQEIFSLCSEAFKLFKEPCSESFQQIDAWLHENVMDVFKRIVPEFKSLLESPCSHNPLAWGCVKRHWDEYFTFIEQIRDWFESAERKYWKKFEHQVRYTCACNVFALEFTTSGGFLGIKITAYFWGRQKQSSSMLVTGKRVKDIEDTLFSNRMIPMTLERCFDYDCYD